MLNLGNLFRTGRAGAKDPARAFQLYQRAALQESPGALNNLADCYERGEGTGKDVDKAILYYKRAAAAGSPEAATSLKRLGK